jgi:hypothetical protein
VQTVFPSPQSDSQTSVVLFTLDSPIINSIRMQITTNVCELSFALRVRASVPKQLRLSRGDVRVSTLAFLTLRSRRAIVTTPSNCDDCNISCAPGGKTVELSLIEQPCPSCTSLRRNRRTSLDTCAGAVIESVTLV